MYGARDGNHVLFYHEGGVDVGDVDSKASSFTVPICSTLTEADVTTLIAKVPAERQAVVGKFLKALYDLFADLHFTYLEINPLVFTGGKCHILDLAAKLDETAGFEVGTKWGNIDFPSPFGRESTPEEKHIADLDAKTGASLKLTILNAEGRIWTMVAGGGASVVYADTICGLGYTDELANYGEYSGAPNTAQTYEYAKTILKLMTKEPHPSGEPKLLIVGGGIANFTNVALTFKGLVQALREFDDALKSVNGRVYVRRGGPNYQEGLKILRELDVELQTPIEVYGPETHMTAIVGMALGIRECTRPAVAFSDPSDQRELVNSDDIAPQTSSERKSSRSTSMANAASAADMAPKVVEQARDDNVIFTSKTRCIIYGMQPRAVQGMLDFDYVCRRETYSVAAMVYPFGGYHTQKFYWGTKEVLIPCYPSVETATSKHPDVDVVVNFSSFRSAYDSTLDVLKYPSIKIIAIIAEGIPEKRTKELLMKAREKNVTIIGPATVGGIKPGCFRIGNTGGMLDNILAAKLYRPGAVAYVSRSGGMSNELNNIISRNADGVFEGVAIGGDRYPGSTFMVSLA
eukprot:Awhi_evm1s678